MKDQEKTYIECRFFILGEKNVGKQSFIEKLNKISSSNTIHNHEEENKFKKKLLKFMKKIEEENEYYRIMQQEKTRQRPKKEEIKKSSLSKKKNTEDKNTENFSAKNETNKFVSSFCKEDKTKIFFQKINELQENSSNYKRPPAPDCPAKLFMFENVKIAIKPYYIYPADKYNDYYTKKDEEDEFDYIFGKDEKYTMKGITEDINEILNFNKKTMVDFDQLNGYRIMIYNVFIYIYDMSNFESFEKIIDYYDILNKYYLKTDSNIISYIIGNKTEIKTILKDEQKNTYDDFFKSNSSIKSYEISTKQYFDFEKFFINLLSDISSKNLDSSEDLKTELNTLIKTKSKFSKAKRSSLYSTDMNYPGPEYDLNIYSFSSKSELEDVFNRKKNLRFNKKIFVNKQGPLYPKKDKQMKEEISLENKNKNLVYISQSNGGLFNKPIHGFTLGTKNGELNLKKSRKDLALKRSKSLIESLESDLTLPYKNDNFKSRGPEYFEEVSKKKEKIQQRKILNRHIKLEKINQIHNQNLEKINQEKENQKKIITKSSSMPNIFNNNSQNFTEDNKQRFYEKVYYKNKEYVDKFQTRRDIIKKNQKFSDTPGPNAYDIRGNLLNPNKGPLILGKRKSVENIREDPSFPTFKDEFEIIVEKAQLKKNSPKKIISKSPEKKIVTEKISRLKPYNEIWEKWEKNKENNFKEGKLKEFLFKIKQNEINQKENMKKNLEDLEQAQQIRRQILMQKGYNDPNEISSINYNLVETSSPKYTIKGRHVPKNKINNDEFGNLLLGSDLEMYDYIKNAQLIRPLPNISSIKPNLPNIVFGHAKRFPENNENYSGGNDLFKDGVFAPKTQKDFSKFGSFSGKEVRTNMTSGDFSNYPSPADYKIKSSFEIIVEQGKIISDNKKRIKMKEELEKKMRMAAEEEKNKKDNGDKSKGKDKKNLDNNDGNRDNKENYENDEE